MSIPPATRFVSAANNFFKYIKFFEQIEESQLSVHTYIECKTT